MSDRPKALRFADALVDVERQIVEALPAIVDGLIARAREGDTRAATYLLDRILGRAAGARAAPADDRELPYGEQAFQLERAALECKPIVRRIVIPGFDDRARDAARASPAPGESGAGDGM